MGGQRIHPTPDSLFVSLKSGWHELQEHGMAITIPCSANELWEGLGS